MVALSGDGRVVAIGAPLSHTDWSSDPLYDAGSARVYAWDDTLNEWVRRGNAFQHDVAYAHFGSSVALSADGNVLAIGAPGYSPFATDTRGRVGVFGWEGGAWAAMGDAFIGPLNDSHIGESVALNARGDVIVIGAHGLHPYDNKNRAGHIDARVHAWDEVAETWGEVGGGIDGGENGLDNLFSSVALNGDGTRMAMGAWPFKGYGNHFNDWEVSQGLVRVYDAVASG
tara:strand:- start:199 stop:882 length:684 start_codon:yes stop_codon:yes gene_type:complete